MIEELKKSLEKVAIKAGIENPVVNLEHPDDISHGDFSTNIALAYAKNLKINPKELAERVLQEFKKDMPKEVAEVSIAGPGFINIKLNDAYFSNEILKIDENYGRKKKAGFFHKKRKVMVEYTDPNPFKEFHVGHLMDNVIGESIALLIESSGAKVIRANWQGDVGVHVAKALWGAMDLEKQADGQTSDLNSAAFWGKAYAHGAMAYEENPEAKAEIDEINVKVYDQSDEKINTLYQKGRKESLEAFEKIYTLLGTKFDNYFFESKEGKNGLEIVKKFQARGIFEESQGAIIFPGEKYGLHTRVFVTSKGLPTYEAKELGLNAEKFKLYPDLSESLIISANEQNDYFKVILKVFSLTDNNIFEKTKHISHGMLRLTTGKMASRTGNVVTAEELIEDTKKLVDEKIKDRNFSEEEKKELSQEVALAAIRYVILRQAIGGDIIYDPEKSVSFEGDSGPYLQYACVRAGTVLLKSSEAGISREVSSLPSGDSMLEKILVRFPEIVIRSQEENAPHYVVTYLTELASTFNSYYANNQIIDIKNPLSPYRVALTGAFVNVMKNGLSLLGIKVPKRM